MLWIHWLIIAGVLFVGEILTPTFVLFWFAIGALISCLISLVTANIYVQVVSFLAVSILLIIFTRPIMKKLLKNNEVASNVYAMAGKRAIVIQEINNLEGRGQVNVSGEVWQARTENDQVIPVQTEVEILRVEGVKVIVAEAAKKLSNREVLK